MYFLVRNLEHWEIIELLLIESVKESKGERQREKMKENFSSVPIFAINQGIIQKF